MSGTSCGGKSKDKPLVGDDCTNTVAFAASKRRQKQNTVGRLRRRTKNPATGRGSDRSMSSLRSRDDQKYKKNWSKKENMSGTTGRFLP